MQNKDYYPIPTNGLRLSAHNRTRIQNAPLSFTFEKLKSYWQHSTKAKPAVPFLALIPIYSFIVFKKGKIKLTWTDWSQTWFSELDGIVLYQKEKHE